MEQKANLTTNQLTSRIEDMAVSIITKADSLFGAIDGSPTPAVCETGEKPYGLNSRLSLILSRLETASMTLTKTSDAFFEPGPPMPEPGYRLANEACYTTR